MQPKLQGDTFYLPTEDGIYLRNNRQTLTLQGQDIYEWIEALEPYLNGHYTLEAILEDLEPEQQEMVQHIVETLSTHGFLKDLSQDLPHSLSERELATYAAEIGFIDSFRASAAAAFEHFRAQRVLVIGSGMTILALVNAILNSGIAQTTVWITDECETFTRRLDACYQHRLEQDPLQVLTRQQVPNWENEHALREALQTFDMIFHLSDRPMIQRSLKLNELCFSLQKPLFQALILNDQALIGPLVRPGEPGCWECTWRRWLSNLDAAGRDALGDPWQDDHHASLSPLLSLPTAACVANILSLECFKYATEAGPCEISGNVFHLNLETLRCQSIPLLPHPLCRVCQQPAPLDETAFLKTIKSLEEQETLQEEIFHQRVVPCFNPLLGIFRYIGEDDFVQVPLNVSSLTTSAPMYPQQPQETLSLIQANLGLDITRHKLTLQGCASYAARLADQRRFFADTNGTWTLAYDLCSRRSQLIPASQAYPIDNIQAKTPSLVGVSAGLSWAEACARALLDHALVLVLQEIALGERDYVELPLQTLELDSQGRHLSALVELTGKPLHIYDIANFLRIPTLAFCVGGETLLYTTHLDRSHALKKGLLSIIQHFQAIQEEQLAYALSPVPQLPPGGAGHHDMQPDYPMSGWQEGLDQLIEIFRQRHWRVLALPLDHDPALQTILPFIVRILLVQEEA